ncbi:hypothetical protein CONPUDRAFT_152321 [Coniophora puteana RWD-64-598 SS2]|uniref:BTB domain-containing protein n=1 Tax=Coniophora puteana (strain RWD-64-598) TaxID=741705 RepID=A0A5M3MW03_CONPW|nr:uncharacterized protein CONPUDRAFT_152321 [Coniophora puteana RWD-64-598 SS2]EIW83296.1 hypothetical protein CONPUDRAFT_152321 [Coniophora puteana RWD-64-598 SS2]
MDVLLKNSKGLLVNSEGYPNGIVQPEDYDYEDDSDFDPDEEAIIEEVDSAGLSRTREREVEAYNSPFASTGSLTSTRVTSSNDTMIVTGAAYQTWKALINYSYTGNVQFLPLTSTGIRKTSPKGVGDELSSSHPCSPKSMYRLADKLELRTLREHAFKAISRDLSASNILDEVTSKFTSEHPKIFQMEMGFLLALRGNPVILQNLSMKMDQIVRGEVPHCKEVLNTIMATLWGKRDHKMSYNY